MNRIRVRFAPSPTGTLHMGGVRTALYNYLLAKKYGGDFILRIEDTDQTRFVAGAEQYIIDSLRWCGIEPTEGVGFGDGPHAPYRQSERKAIYKQYADQLVANGTAYYAFDTAEELDALREQLKEAKATNLTYGAESRHSMCNATTLDGAEVQRRLAAGEPFVIRFKMPDNEEVVFQDLVRGAVSFRTSELDDKVLFKSDGMPTYHLANVVDDFLMQISHVIRGEEWLSSTPLHVLLYRALGVESAMPKFAHLPLILKPDGNGKLSKRDGDRLGFPSFTLNWTDPETGAASVGYRERGFLPEAYLNFLALLGWSAGGDRELMSKDEMVQLFSIEKINKAGARFDYDKAKWFNQQYIMAAAPAETARRLRPDLALRGYEATDVFLENFVILMRERAVFLTDFLEKGYYCFEPVREYDRATLEKKWKPENSHKFKDLQKIILDSTATTATELEQEIKDWLPTVDLKPGDVLPLLRIALTGTTQGPAVFDLLLLLGKPEAARRLEFLNTAAIQ